MSIYATWVSLDGSLVDSPAPAVYEGSHLYPRGRRPKRGGFVLLCAVPNHCHRSARGGSGSPVNWLRLSVREDADTERELREKHPECYTRHGGLLGTIGDATVLLDRAQVVTLRDTLTDWLDSEEKE